MKNNLKMVNCLLLDMTNNEGSSYGTTYIFFPEVQYRKEDILKLIPAETGSWLERQLSEYIESGPERITWISPEERKALEEKDSNDIWNQVHLRDCASIKEALDYYFAVD